MGKYLLLEQFFRCVLGLLRCEVVPPKKPQASFSKIKIDDTTIKGTINMIKFETNQAVTFTAGNFLDRRGNPANIEAGSAVWTVIAQDADGNPVNMTLDVDPANELSATLISAETEVTGVVRFEGDGDTDADEESLFVATADFIVDASNVATGDLTAGTPVDA